MLFCMNHIKYQKIMNLTKLSLFYKKSKSKLMYSKQFWSNNLPHNLGNMHITQQGSQSGLENTAASQPQ